MNQIQELIDIITTIRNKINDTTDVVWTKYENANDLQMEIDKVLNDFIKGDMSMLDKFYYWFLPTSTFQEISISNGWINEYIVLSNKFDKLYDKLKI